MTEGLARTLEVSSPLSDAQEGGTELDSGQLDDTVSSGIVNVSVMTVKGPKPCGRRDRLADGEAVTGEVPDSAMGIDGIPIDSEQAEVSAAGAVGGTWLWRVTVSGMPEEPRDDA